MSLPDLALHHTPAPRRALGGASLMPGTCQGTRLEALLKGGARLPQYEPDGAKILAFRRCI